MAITKRVIVLEQIGTSPLMFRYLMWADVPATRQAFYAAKQANMISAWKDAQPADNTALQNGSVTEFVDVTAMQAGDTLLTAEARLQAIWTAFQATINATNNWSRYGSFMDTTNTWTAGGVS
jgi:hypothetical protein